MKDSEDMGELFRQMREASQANRSKNRESSAQLLKDAGIQFDVKNGGAHLIVAGAWDFWPGTGLWSERKPTVRGRRRRGRGVRALIATIRHQGQT